LEFGLVSQEEFEPEEDRHGITRRIAAGEFGQQREGSAEEGGLIRRKPNIDPAQVASLAGPGGSNSGDRLPVETLLVDVKRDDGEAQ
jgi:hypothetical protein